MKYRVEYSTISDIHTVIKIFDFSTFGDDSCEYKAGFSFNGPKRPSKKNDGNRIDILAFGSIHNVKFMFWQLGFGTQNHVEYSSQAQKQKNLQKIDFFKNEEKNQKNRNGVTSENVSRLPKKNLVVVWQKLRSVFCFDAPGVNAKGIP